MTKQRKAQALTITVLLGALAVAVIGRSGWRPSLPSTVSKADPTPQDAVYAMLDAAREGDVGQYLTAYTGPMETSLKQAIAEQTEAGFARYLKETNAPIKGIAITEPQALTDREVKVRVEYVYQDRNEVQLMYLEKLGRAWKIARMDAAERIKTLVPYGTPVQ